MPQRLEHLDPTPAAKVRTKNQRHSPARSPEQAKSSLKSWLENSRDRGQSTNPMGGIGTFH